MAVTATAIPPVESLTVVRLIEEHKRLWTLYHQSVKDLEYCERYESDLLHGLEFGVPLTKKGTPDKLQIMKIGSALSECMRKRREAKDLIQKLEPFAQWYEKCGQTAMNSLGPVVGQMRQVEGKLENRRYQPRTHQGEAMLKDVATKHKPTIGGEKCEDGEPAPNWEDSIMKIAEAIQGNSETELLIPKHNEGERKKRLLPRQLTQQPIAVGGE